MRPSFDRSILITMRLTASGTIADLSEVPVVVARRHHVAGYPVMPELSTMTTIESIDELLDTIREWIEAFTEPDPDPGPETERAPVPYDPNDL